MGWKDSTGKEREVRAVRMNCVDFVDVCKSKGIDEFPTIRLFRSDGSSARFEDRRTAENILAWLETSVKTVGGWAKDHEEFETGCNAVGYIQVPRMPGILELFAGDGNHTLDPTM